MRFLAITLLAAVTVTATPIVQEESVRSNVSINEVDTICDPEKRFNEYCNACVCSYDGKSKVCTQLTCPPNVFNKDGSLKYIKEKKVKICEPGSLFKDDCNDCHCAADGLSTSCTFNLCIPTITKITKKNRSASNEKSSKMCEPQTIFKNKCNECICAADGRTVDCSVKLCIPALVINLSYHTIQSPMIACQPGKSFQDQCNDCKCSDDGTRALCTLKYCTADETHVESKETDLGSRIFPTIVYWTMRLIYPKYIWG